MKTKFFFTAPCAVVRPWESIVIGVIGGALAISSMLVVDKLKVDDPVAASSVHGTCGLWGLLAVGLFAHNDDLENTTQGRAGLFQGGGFYLLGVQFLGGVVTIVWTAIFTYLMLMIIHKTIGLRMTEEEEELGADYVEHMISFGLDLEEHDSGRNKAWDSDEPKTKNDKMEKNDIQTIKNTTNITKEPTIINNKVHPLNAVGSNGDLTEISA
ncbi:hypothetical protein FSP39_020288 [Pinctada imbricata]|uniref:Ammonium transporter AmtB-like domain-containing protein n=1 Tax=Pinctada imbricata TaxID=66713 RepID=A0AA88Y5H2_PINIB|nr:hypothetical protein FSP39_020288 [Pinctada imbricata]